VRRTRIPSPDSLSNVPRSPYRPVTDVALRCALARVVRRSVTTLPASTVRAARFPCSCPSTAELLTYQRAFQVGDSSSSCLPGPHV
jgi:hypothetical protein